MLTNKYRVAAVDTPADTNPNAWTPATLSRRKHVHIPTKEPPPTSPKWWSQKYMRPRHACSIIPTAKTMISWPADRKQSWGSRTRMTQIHAVCAVRPEARKTQAENTAAPHASPLGNDMCDCLGPSKMACSFTTRWTPSFCSSALNHTSILRQVQFLADGTELIPITCTAIYLTGDLSWHTASPDPSSTLLKQ
eukprot:scaffold7384_cov396-Prasinococcus_capsulatus_cf.AAC.12